MTLELTCPEILEAGRMSQTIGVHTILNPSDSREQHAGPSSSVQRPLEGGSSPSSTAWLADSRPTNASSAECYEEDLDAAISQATKLQSLCNAVKLCRPPAATWNSTACTESTCALHTSGAGVRGSEVQPHLTLQTNTGEHITVPLDVHQGSRQADEKRHRNAGASARFRARKKERDKDMRETLQRLEAENREVSRLAQELQAESDFYRSERDRLRELVLRTPEIREHAERGPPSPRSAHVAPSPARPAEASFASSFAVGANPPTAASPSPMMQQQQQQQQQQQHPPPYSGDLERPTRRRRTDPPAADFESVLYPIRSAQQPTSTLPPIVTQGLTTPVTSGPPSARLPPLRFDQPGASPTAAQTTPGGFGPQPSQQPPLQTQFPPQYSRLPHETGWATGAREQQDNQRPSPGPSGL
ncbi:hypothetical protein M406DRAFT_325830 [Cryphonectria parasitica EP155]|uniref:BZIP domain-containing protein n=1 Tax=Cryphonectria parasitica (strain ATCC 38755 / EP155) TaxID=660469 RepID=A0A9P4YCJ8_CRYP1|nr:uncharacterized protein M406DRAFT_325830 [Cryphonectria parasitica EP155]KAF3770382.1 hypothetical protein M406DRAFT_325830 [Cryphonectria parasitica EP155]